MRRSALGAILFGLALLAQVIAAAATGQAAAADGLGHFTACMPGGVPGAGQPAQDERPSPHQHCALCFIICTPAAALRPSTGTLAVPQPRVSHVAWRDSYAQLGLSGFKQQAFPRGPPEFT